MRKIILFLLIALCATVQSARADEFDKTGLYAINFGPFGGYLPSAGPIYMGGPGGVDDYGYAMQFSFDNDTLVSDLIVRARVLPSFDRPTTGFEYKLYGGGIATPDLSSLALTSDPVSFTADAHNEDFYNFTIPFSYNFAPGTYWLAQEGSGGAIVYTDTGFIDPPRAAVIPEPSTWALLAVGLIAMLAKRKDILDQLQRPVMVGDNENCII